MPEKYWGSIDEMPLYNWIKCNNGHLEYVRNGRGNKANDVINWMRLYNEYLATFGLDKRYKKYLEVKRKKALLQAEYVIKKDRFKLTEIITASYLDVKGLSSHAQNNLCRSCTSLRVGDGGHLSGCLLFGISLGQS